MSRLPSAHVIEHCAQGGSLAALEKAFREFETIEAEQCAFV